MGPRATRPPAAELRGLPRADGAPLALAFGAVLSIFGDGADRLLVLFTLLSLVALAAGTYSLGRICFTPFVGVIAAFLVLTRFDFPSLAVRGYIDIPFMATVVWAGASRLLAPGAERLSSYFLPQRA